MQTMLSRWSRRGAAWVAAGVLTVVGVAACSPDTSTAPPGPPPTSAAPRPTRTVPPDKADDLARAKRSLITAEVLGKPWVAAKTVHSAGTKGEACPGQPTTDASVAPLASATRSFTAGKKAGAAISVISVWTYADQADVDAFRVALPDVLQGCRSYTDRSKMYVVLTPSRSVAIDGADETWRYAERIYYDKKHTELAYARHYVIARSGRVLSSVQYAFLTSRADPSGKDFSTTEEMARQQLDRVVAAFDNR